METRTDWAVLHQADFQAAGPKLKALVKADSAIGSPMNWGCPVLSPMSPVKTITGRIPPLLVKHSRWLFMTLFINGSELTHENFD